MGAELPCLRICQAAVPAELPPRRLQFSYFNWTAPCDLQIALTAALAGGHRDYQHGKGPEGLLLVSCRGGGDLPQTRRPKTRDIPSLTFRGGQKSETEVLEGRAPSDGSREGPSCLCLVSPDGGRGPWCSLTYGYITSVSASSPSKGPSHLDLGLPATPG